jgi:2-C-methyl-D-erythritol 2,4-cyclodiphosphate synthase
MYRIGQSTDIHQLVKDRKLIIGGVEIPYHLGLKGHSDADVLLHAIAEAILGALGLNDLGCLFPDSDKKYKDISSMILLEQVYNIMDQKGYKINNVDSLVIIEKPRLREYISQMQENIAKVLHTDISNINVKATCSEGIGFIGRQEGAVAQAVVMLIKK